MGNAIERVTAACLSSKFKDDRHEWTIIMTEDAWSVRTADWTYVLRRCRGCRLIVLTHTHPESNRWGPINKNDVNIHAFFEEGQ